jgi:sugar lactone lactonase YvrE
VLDNGKGEVLHVNPLNGNVYNVLASGFPNEASLNALTFDFLGNGFVSDSGLGRIYMIPFNGGGSTWTIWNSDQRLKALNQWQQCTPNPPPTPPTCITGTATLLPSVGANGVEFLPPGCATNPQPPGGQPRCRSLYVANTANRNIISIPVNDDGTAGVAFTGVNGINGPDGIAIDGSNNIWVAANQSDEIVVTNPTGEVIAKLGDFGGIDSESRVIGLLFPASLAFSNDRKTLFVSNAAFTGARSIDTPWTQRVRNYTVSKIVLPTTNPPIPTTGLFVTPP